MRRLELLVQEVRDSSDSNDLNSYSVYELMRYFNDGQKIIQKIVHSSNALGVFDKILDQAIVSGRVDMPVDVYAKSSINSVGYIRSNGYFSKLDPVTYAEFDNFFGYAIVDDVIFVPEKNSTDNIRVNYTYQLPVLSYRLAKIASFDAGADTITLDGATLIADDTFNNRYETFSVVDKKGVQKATNLHLDDRTGLVLTMDSAADFGTLAVGDWVVCGKSGTSHGKLPDECEPYLLSYVQRRVKDKISSSDAAGESLFTREERQDIEDLFADISRDMKYPVATDLDFMGI